LFEINEVLGGKGERFIKQIESKLDNSRNATPADTLKVFSAFQTPINRNREQGKLLEGKSHKDMKIESNYDDADDERGEEIFGQINQEIVRKKDNFNFYPHENQNQTNNNSEIIQDVKNNPQN
jgi:hypothetical protein